MAGRFRSDGRSCGSATSRVRRSERNSSAFAAPPTRGWNKNERATELYEKVMEALGHLKGWQLSWVPREMNKDADKLVDQAFKGEPVTHATD